MHICSITLLMTLFLYTPAQDQPETKVAPLVPCAKAPASGPTASTSAGTNRERNCSDDGKAEQATGEPASLRRSLVDQSSSARKGASDQATPPADQAGGASDKNDKEESKNGEVVLAPYPISSPALGAGIQWVAGYVFRLNKEDKVTPPSFIGTAGMYTNNGSWGMIFGGSLHLKEGKYRVAAAVADGNVNFDFYGIGRVGRTVSMGVSEAF